MKDGWSVAIITENKEAFMPWLLLADEQEDMIRRYLDRGAMFVLYDREQPVTCCVVTREEGEGVWEIQNLATLEPYQRRGYGQALVEHVCDFYREKGRTMLVGTGDSPMTVPFYERCGFIFSHRLVDYMPQHYDHPIMENGVELRDKLYFKREL